MRTEVALATVETAIEAFKRSLRMNPRAILLMTTGALEPPLHLYTLREYLRNQLAAECAWENEGGAIHVDP